MTGLVVLVDRDRAGLAVDLGDLDVHAPIFQQGHPDRQRPHRAIAAVDGSLVRGHFAVAVDVQGHVLCQQAHPAPAGCTAGGGEETLRQFLALLPGTS